MSEQYPSDADLLALADDEHTGVEYIPTGKTPYYLEFRKLIQRLTLAAARSSDLRPFQASDLTIGVKPGRCVIDETTVNFTGDGEVALTNNATTKVSLDAQGDLQTTTGDFPEDRSTFLPITAVTTSGGAITEIIDLRGEAFLQSPIPRDGLWMNTLYTGDLTANQSDAVCAMIPVDGTITDVLLTIGTNIVSDDGDDGVSVMVKVNGTSLCTTNPSITDDAGSGRRSTAKSEGTAAVLDSSHIQVSAGDVLSWAITLTNNGTVTTNPADVAIAVRILPD
ncbi:MAG: hypothetical protein KAS72_15720 [Phycisphaerales bacterium]|nr:hypothetical protein [Phycisphaerales bacterium]